MSMTYQWQPHREAASASGAWSADQAGHDPATQVSDRIVCLEALAAQMHARGWTAYISTPAGRLASLFVQDPHDRTECSDIVVAPGGTAGDWWYWFSWAERIAPVHAPAAAADAIIRAFQRPTDAPPAPPTRAVGGAP